jgi:hypothetical protein
VACRGSSQWFAGGQRFLMYVAFGFVTQVTVSVWSASVTAPKDRFVVMARGQHPANPSHGEFMEGGSAMLRTVITVLVIVILVIVLLRLL